MKMVFHVNDLFVFMLKLTGEAIANNIIWKLDDWELGPELLWGQTYDSAGAMPGQLKGAAACITSMYPKAIYTHCASDRLNLEVL